MNPMTRLVLATLVFLATHYVSSTPWRSRLVRLLGEGGYLVLYSAAAVAALTAMAWSYYRAPALTLWNVPLLRWAPSALMPAAFVLAAAGLTTRNPTLVGQAAQLQQDGAVRGILRVTRHPLMWAIALWAGAHILARGDAASAVFFGAFLLLALSGTALVDARKRAAAGGAWTRFAAATSNVPFFAIAAGRNQFVWEEIGWWRVAAGLALYGITLALHGIVFGARPY